MIDMHKKDFISVASGISLLPKKKIFKFSVSFKKQTSKPIEVVPISSAGPKAESNYT